MNAIISVFILAFFFAASSFAAKPAIENPSADVLKKEAAILSRVLALGEDMSCSSVWIDTGLILTASHCQELIEDFEHEGKIYSGLYVGGVAVQVLAKTNVKMKGDESEGSGSKSSNYFDPRLNPFDFMLVLVNPTPLQAKFPNLPTEPLDIAPEKEGKIEANTELLIAGYGLQKLVVDEDGSPVPTEKRSAELGAAYMKTTTSAPESPFDIQAEVARDVVATSECEKKESVYQAIKMSCTFQYDFSSNSKNKGPIILYGDSGGPAFRKRANGKWELLGLAHGGNMIPETKRRLEFRLSLNGKRPQRLEVSVQKESWDARPESDLTPMQQFHNQFVSMSYAVMKKVFESSPRASSKVSTMKLNATTDGMLYSYHVNLANPVIHGELAKAITIFKKVLADALKSK